MFDSATIKLVLYLTLAAGAGSGGSALYTTIRDPRPNPYTSIDGQRDKTFIVRHLDRNEAAISDLTDRVHLIQLVQHDVLGDIKRIAQLLDEHGDRRNGHPKIPDASPR